MSRSPARRPALRAAIVAIVVSLTSLYMVAKDHLDRRPQLSNSRERYVRERVVQLTSERGFCSGVQVVLPSGHQAILTAAHCNVLMSEGSILAAFDGARPIPRRVLEVSPTADLMLLEALPEVEGIHVAERSVPLERVSALTHALSFPTRLDEGEFLVDMRIEIPVAPADTAEEAAACMAVPKQRVQSTFMGSICLMSVVETVSNIHIAPGSSGGPAVNTSGELVGIASAGNDDISAWVPLKDIQAFLRPY